MHTKSIFAFALISFLCLMNSLAVAQKYFLYVGTYTRKTSAGIYIYEFNTETGDNHQIDVSKGNTNPSFLAISPDNRFLYSLAGDKGDSVKSFSIDKSSHKLTPLNGQSLAGSFGACYLEVDKTGRWLIAGNYGSGSVTVLPIEKDGSVAAVSQTIVHEGKSVDPERQQRPYVHSINIAPNNRDVFVPDLGTDKIVTYQLNAETGHLSHAKVPFVPITPGSGPRHFTFHPNGKFAYLIQELDASVTAFYYYKDGTLKAFQTVRNLPPDYTGRKWAADIHISPDGRFLYASNRAHESLGIFAIDQQSGMPTLAAHQDVHGKTPRNFVIDPTGNFLLVANQDSDNITIFKRDLHTGKLTYTGKEIIVSQAVCLKFIP